MKRQSENRAGPPADSNGKTNGLAKSLSGFTGYDFTIVAATPAGELIKDTFFAGTPCGKVDAFLRQAGVCIMNP